MTYFTHPLVTPFTAELNSNSTSQPGAAAVHHTVTCLSAVILPDSLISEGANGLFWEPGLVELFSRCWVCAPWLPGDSLPLWPLLPFSFPSVRGIPGWAWGQGWVMPQVLIFCLVPTGVERAAVRGLRHVCGPVHGQQPLPGPGRHHRRGQGPVRGGRQPQPGRGRGLVPDQGGWPLEAYFLFLAESSVAASLTPHHVSSLWGLGPTVLTGTRD